MIEWLQSQNNAAGTAHRAVSSQRSHLFQWLASFGGLGIFAVSVLDSSIIPLPIPGTTDILLLLLSAHRGTTAVAAIWLAFCALAGSMLGGYLTWSAGRKGGEVVLEHYVPKRFLGIITGWVQRHGALSIALSSLMPPPVPLTPFLLAAGALNVPRGRFLAFFAIARAIRYGLLAWLGITFGHVIVRNWLKDFDHWSSTILWVYGGLAVAGIGFGIWKFRRHKALRGRAQAPAQDVA